MDVTFNKLVIELARAMDKELGERGEINKDAESEELKKLSLLFKACQLVILADRKTSISETLLVGNLVNECKKYISKENVENIISLVGDVTEEDIKKEIEENNYSREYLMNVMQFSIKLAQLGGLTVEEKLVIEKLKHIFGLA